MSLNLDAFEHDINLCARYLKETSSSSNEFQSEFNKLGSTDKINNNSNENKLYHPAASISRSKTKIISNSSVLHLSKQFSETHSRENTSQHSSPQLQLQICEDEHEVDSPPHVNIDGGYSQLHYVQPTCHENPSSLPLSDHSLEEIRKTTSTPSTPSSSIKLYETLRDTSPHKVSYKENTITEHNGTKSFFSADTHDAESDGPYMVENVVTIETENSPVKEYFPEDDGYSSLSPPQPMPNNNNKINQKKTKSKFIGSGKKKGYGHQEMMKNKMIKKKRKPEENAKSNNWTFKPKINQKFQQNRKIPINRRINAWLKTKEENKKKNGHIKLQLEEKELKECTFKPHIISDKKKRKNTPIRKNVVNRLYARGSQKYAVRERKKQRLESYEMNQHAFKPQIKNYKNLNKNYVPIYERVGQLQRERNNKSLRLKHKVANEEECTFKPQISEKSRKIVKELNYNHSSIGERLIHQRSSNVIRSLRKKKLRKEELDKECTFKPKITKYTDEIMDKSQNFPKTLNNSEDKFLKRQEEYKMKSLAKQLDVIDRSEKNKNCTFRPHIGWSEKILKKSNRHRERIKYENVNEMCERLSTQDAKLFKQRKKILEKEQYEHCTFKPELSKRSLLIGRESGLDALVTDEVKKRKIHTLKRSYEQKFQDEHPFKPQIQANSKSSSGFEDVCTISIMNNIDKYKEEKEEKIKLARQEFEKELMKDCTFHPNILTSTFMKEQKESVIVRGLSKFLETKDLALKKQRDKKTRLKQAYSVDPKILENSRKHGCTKFAPFNLTKTKSKISKERKKKTLNNAHRSKYGECTFKPKTCEYAKRRIIEKLLYSDETSSDSCLNSSMEDMKSSLDDISICSSLD